MTDPTDEAIAAYGAQAVLLPHEDTYDARVKIITQTLYGGRPVTQEDFDQNTQVWSQLDVGAVRRADQEADERGQRFGALSRQRSVLDQRIKTLSKLKRDADKEQRWGGDGDAYVARSNTAFTTRADLSRGIKALRLEAKMVQARLNEPYVRAPGPPSPSVPSETHLADLIALPDVMFTANLLARYTRNLRTTRWGLEGEFVFPYGDRMVHLPLWVHGSGGGLNWIRVSTNTDSTLFRIQSRGRLGETVETYTFDNQVSNVRGEDIEVYARAIVSAGQVLDRLVRRGIRTWSAAMELAEIARKAFVYGPGGEQGARDMAQILRTREDLTDDIASPRQRRSECLALLQEPDGYNRLLARLLGNASESTMTGVTPALPEAGPRTTQAGYKEYDHDDDQDPPAS